MSERILVVDTCDEMVSPVVNFNGVSTDIARLDSLMLSIHRIGIQNCFMPRDEVEKDPRYLQLIPYVILQYRDKYCSYVRGSKSGEKRLVGNRAIGLGGHIKESDIYEGALPFCTVLKAEEREVREEVNIEGRIQGHITLGLIRDSSNEVGTVHMGIVFLWELTTGNVISNEENEIIETKFNTFDELLEVAGTMERWSVLCLPLLKNC